MSYLLLEYHPCPNDPYVYCVQFTHFGFSPLQVRVMEERLQAEWTTHLPDQAEKEQAISKLATQVEEQVCRQKSNFRMTRLS